MGRSLSVARPQEPPTVEEILRYPRTVAARVAPEYIDAMGHMNITWYMFLFDRASWEILARLGLDEEAMQRKGTGAFAVEQRVRYLAELRLGDRIDVYTRVSEIGTRSIQFMHLMVDAERRRVAATIDTVAVHVDRTTRKAVPFEERVVRAAGLMIGRLAGVEEARPATLTG